MIYKELYLLYNLKHLIICSCDSLTNIECLKDLINLEKLDLFNTNGIINGIETFIDSITPTKKLNLSIRILKKSESTKYYK